MAKEDFSDSSSEYNNSDKSDDNSDVKPAARKSSNISKFTKKEIIRMIGAVLEFGYKWGTIAFAVFDESRLPEQLSQQFLLIKAKLNNGRAFTTLQLEKLQQALMHFE